MSIAIADNFSYRGSKPLDARFQFDTVANMKDTTASDLYDGCFAYVVATKKYYSYDSANSSDPTTGKWREYSSGGGGGGSYTAGDGIDITNSVISTDNATSEDMEEILTPLPSVMSRRFKYLTEEQVVGEWIDGKPLYQKVYHSSNISLDMSDKHYSVDVEANFIPSKKLINCYGRYDYTYDTSTFECVLGHQILSDTSDAVVVTSAVYANTSTNSLVFKFSQTNNTTVAKTLSDIYIVVQYTKTAD